MSGASMHGSDRSAGGALRVVLSALLLVSFMVVQSPSGAEGEPPPALSPELASVSTSFEPGDGDSQPPVAMSADGRWVAFTSQATNLTGDGGFNAVEVYRRDFQTGLTERVSLAHDAGAADGPSSWPSISADGRMVAFSSWASDLVDHADDNDRADIFVRDMDTGTTIMLGKSGQGGIQGDANAARPSISADGNWVVFQSSATNLDPRVDPGVTHIYIGEVGQHDFELVSVSTAGVVGNDSSEGATVSGDGRYVAFATYATNLGGNVSSGMLEPVRNIYIRDRELETTTLVTQGFSGAGDLWQTAPANGDSGSPQVSAQGTYIVFDSAASNLLQAPDTNGTSDIFLYEIGASMGQGTSRISDSADGTQADEDCMRPAISGNDRYIVFDSATQVLAEGKTTSHLDVLVYDRTAEEFKRVSHRSDGVEGDGPSQAAAITNDGRFVAFVSGATNLHPGGTSHEHVYRADRMVLEGPDEWTDPPLPPVIPVAGANRFATAIDASNLAYPEGLDPEGALTVVIATGMNWPDALGGTALAGAVDGPILLVGTNTMPAGVLAEIERLGAEKAIILGGTSAVGPAVQAALETALEGAANVDRIAGTDRYETANQIALRVISILDDSYYGTAFVATGGNFPDALAAAPLAAAHKVPLYLANPATGLSASTVAAMADVEDALILGGTGVVSAAVETQLGDLLDGDVERLWGPDRFGTAVAVAEFAVEEGGHDWDRVGITTGMDFPDALAGGVVQGKAGSVMLLTTPTVLNAQTQAALAANADEIDTVTFFGGPNAVSDAVRTAALAAAGVVP